VLDGKTTPVKTISQIVNGTRAHVTFWLTNDATYELKEPSGGSIATATSLNKNVTFRDVNLATSGWYKLYRAGLEVTKFEAIQYSGSFNIGSAQVLKMTSDDLAAVTPVLPYPQFKGVYWDALAAPKCGLLGSHDPPTTWNVPLDSPRMLKMIFPWTVRTDPDILPAIGVTITGQAKADTELATGNVLVWELVLIPDPNNTYPGIVNQLVLGIVTATQTQTIDGRAWAAVDDVITPCFASSIDPPFSWTVQAG
jgi:hypothetical protein